MPPHRPRDQTLAESLSLRSSPPETPAAAAAVAASGGVAAIPSLHLWQACLGADAQVVRGAAS